MFGKNFSPESNETTLLSNWNYGRGVSTPNLGAEVIL